MHRHGWEWHPLNPNHRGGGLLCPHHLPTCTSLNLAIRLKNSEATLTRPPPMALEPGFVALVKACFDESAKVLSWLEDEGIRTAEDFALLACEEWEVGDKITEPAKTAGAHGNRLKEQIAFKKLWIRCRGVDEETGTAGEAAETETGLCDRARKSCETGWVQKHGYTLSPARRLVGTQMGPMHSMSHAVPPNPKDFPLLAVRRMKLQDGSLGSQSTDAEITGSYQIYLKVRAFFLSFAFVCMDIPDHFNLGAAENVNDKILTFLFAQHPGGRPPVQFYAEAWDATARVFQVGVRSGKTLVALTESDSLWQHHWTAYTPAPRGQPSTSTNRTEGQQQRGGRRGSKSKNDKEDSDAIRIMQQKKDRQIAQLKRDLEETRRSASSQSRPSQPSSSQGQWKARRKW